MAAAAADKLLESQLIEYGKKLLKPPSSVDQLLHILDKVEIHLSKVEQSPSESMHSALTPSIKALVANELLRHPDVDVKVSVASCISEITRITAPDAPYEDDQMKEIFQLIVGSFEKLYDTSSRSYHKRASILETVAKVRSCVVMLDLECDGLIIEMFQHFLKAIRDNQHAIFSSMETIMVLVLEESEEISTELLCPLLISVKKENQDVLPIAKRLAEEVLEKCAAKVKPYLMQAVLSLSTSVHDYSKVVAAICQESCGNIKNDDVCAFEEHLDDQEKTKLRVDSHEATQVVDEHKPEADEQKPEVAEEQKPEAAEEEKPEVAEEEKPEVAEEEKPEVAEEEKPEVAEEEKPEVAEEEKPEVAEENEEVADVQKPEVAEEKKPVVTSGALESIARKSEKPVTSNGTSGKSDTLISSDGLQKEVISSATIRPTEDELNVNTSKTADSETNLDPVVMEPEDQKLDTSTHSAEVSDHSRTLSDKQDGEHEDKKKSHSAEANSSPLKECSLGETAGPSENEKLKSPTVSQNETVDAASPSHSQSLLEETHSKKGARQQKKNTNTRDSELDSSSAHKGGFSQDQNEGQTSSSADVVSDKENKGEKGSKEEQAVSEDEAPPSAEVISQSDSKVKKSSGEKKNTRSRRKARASEVRSSRLMGDILATKSGLESDSEAKPVGLSSKTVDDKSSKEDELSDIKEEVRTKNGRGKSKTEKEVTGESCIEVDASKEDEIPHDKSIRTKRGRGKVNSKEVTGEPSSTKKDVTEEPCIEVDASKEDEISHDKDIRTKKGRGKVNSKEVTEEPSDKVSSPKSTESSDKEQSHLVVTPSTKSKRKRAPGSDVTEKTPKSVVDAGKELIGQKVKVWWPDDKKFYQGTVDSYNRISKKHRVTYTDGEIEKLDLKKETWEAIEEFEPEEYSALSPDSSETHQKKKGKKELDSSTSKTKTNTSTKRDSSNKSKGSSSKRSKSKDERSTEAKEEKDDKSKDTTPKAKSKLKETPKTQGDKVKGSSKYDDATPLNKGKGDSNSKVGPNGTSAAKKRKSDSSSKAQEVSSPGKKGKAEESENKSGGKNNAQKSGSKSGRKRPRK
ncbi:hypothetical protein C5167_003645 [Papaver somniferum]|uniref:Tudor domain-containing protein n=1 Tax=Papaver somniferum TaxID=3469 RepID=A0A4Y7L442_PAPSO|nr:titin-like isoform X2 [Papaver somniferum]RZC79402.1 hypothetical protein C5167_003645 [Papaver somniferum]